MPRGSAPGERRGGRQKGTKNKRTLAREQHQEQAAKLIEAALPQAFKGSAHALLMTVYKNTELPLETRISAAKAAIRYEAPAFRAIDSGLTMKTHGDESTRRNGSSRVDEIVARFSLRARN